MPHKSGVASLGVWEGDGTEMYGGERLTLVGAVAEGGPEHSDWQHGHTPCIWCKMCLMIVGQEWLQPGVLDPTYSKGGLG